MLHRRCNEGRRSALASARAHGWKKNRATQGGGANRCVLPEFLVAEDGGYFDAPQRGVAYRIDGPAWVNNHAHILRALAPHLTTEFLHRAFRHFNFMSFISGTTRAKLTQGQLNSVKLFVPPFELQADFGGHVTAVEKLNATHRASLADLDALFASLQHRAFRCEL